MKILQINKYHFIRGGSDSVYFNTSKLLLEHGHQVIHFAMKFDENETSSESSYFADNTDFTKLSGLKKLFKASKFVYNKDAAHRLKKLILKEKPDIAHLHIFYGSLTSSILRILKRYHIPVVISVHDYKLVCPAYLFLNGKNEICEKCQGKFYYKAIKNKCVKGSSLYSTVFAIESYFRDYFFPFHKMFDKLIFVSRFSSAIHNKYKSKLGPITSQLYNFDPALILKKPNKVRGSYYLYAGRLSKEKGVRTLIEAFRNLPFMQLKIAGSGEENEGLQQVALSNVQFLGHQSGETLQKLISNSSFVIIPSEWYENNPMAIIEAYSLGKPVIAADIGGIPEIVIEKSTGYLFQSGNVKHLTEIILKADTISEKEYELMSSNAVAFANVNFHPEQHYIKLIALYNSILKN